MYLDPIRMQNTVMAVVAEIPPPGKYSPDCLELAGKVVRHQKGGGVQLCSLLYTLRMTVSRNSAFLIAESVSFYHSWASASRANAASTGIPASIISARYHSIPVPFRV